MQLAQDARFFDLFLVQGSSWSILQRGFRCGEGWARGW